MILEEVKGGEAISYWKWLGNIGSLGSQNKRDVGLAEYPSFILMNVLTECRQ